MSVQLLEDKVLLSDFLRDSVPNPTEEHIEEVVRVLTFSVCVKLARKFNRLHRQGKITDGMIITVKDKKSSMLYAGKVYIEPDKVGIGTFEIYIDEGELLLQKGRN